MDNKLLGTLGLAARARKITYGETLFENLRKKKVFYCLIDETISERSLKQITSKCTYYNVEYYVTKGMDLASAVGKRNIKSIGILDQNFVTKIKTLIEEEKNNG